MSPLAPPPERGTLGLVGGAFSRQLSDANRVSPLVVPNQRRAESLYKSSPSGSFSLARVQPGDVDVDVGVDVSSPGAMSRGGSQRHLKAMAWREVKASPVAVSVVGRPSPGTSLGDSPKTYFGASRAGVLQ